MPPSRMICPRVGVNAMRKPFTGAVRNELLKYEPDTEDEWFSARHRE